jgi:uncharacterized coiled-coil protein SlyX
VTHSKKDPGSTPHSPSDTVNAPSGQSSHGQQLERIETKLSFHEHSIESLEELVAAQQRQIDELSRLCEAIKSRYQALLDLAERSGIDPGDERPPHY